MKFIKISLFVVLVAIQTIGSLAIPIDQGNTVHLQKRNIFDSIGGLFKSMFGRKRDYEAEAIKQQTVPVVPKKDSAFYPFPAEPVFGQLTAEQIARAQ